MEQARVIPAASYRRERWRNGAGWTRQVHAQPSASAGDAWDWRISIAEIEADAAFSGFPGVERILVLLQGEGLRLRFDDGEVQTLLPPYQRLRFAGERGVRGELVDGATTDFNLMWRRGTIDAELWHRPLVGSMAIFADAGSTWIAYMLAGQAQFDDACGLPSLMTGDTAILPGGNSRSRYLLDGAGELLVIRLTSL